MPKLEQAMQLLNEAEDRIRRAKAIVEGETGTKEESPWAGGLLLADLLEEGGSVTKDRLYELAAKYGMDNRGLGGFYTGKGSLQNIDELQRVMLTSDGVKTAREYIRRRGGPLPGASYEPGGPNLARLSEPSFAEDWNSPEDAAYDRI